MDEGGSEDDNVACQDFLLAGSSLSVEHSFDVLRSPGGTFICGFYNISSNASTFSIWFSNTSEKTVVWSANPLHPVYTWGSMVKLGSDGRMVLKDYNGQTVWTNNVSSSNAQQVQLLDTGNLIVKGKGDIILWQSFASPTNTLLPTQSINATMKLVSTNRLLVRGRYSLRFDDQYLLSMFDDEKDLSFIYWPNPTMTIWDKHRKPFNSTTAGVLDNWGHFLGSDNTTFTAADWGPGIMRRLALDYDGNLRLYSLNKADRT
ncbi:putative receptor protein kinase ZmPK1, partial [Dichanthelium oligosanthes]